MIFEHPNHTPSVDGPSVVAQGSEPTAGILAALLVIFAVGLLLAARRRQSAIALTPEPADG